MEKEFIPYNLALILKELGFNEKCFGFYDLSYKCRLAFTSDQNFYEQQKCSAPTFSQAFRWFRKTHNLHKFVHYHTKPSYTFAVFCDIEMYWTLHEGISFNSYEEAEIECLKKLIEIVKEQNVK